jgi:hypothetical protein
MAGCWHSIQQANLPQKTVAHRSYRRETVDGQNNEPICTTMNELLVGMRVIHQVLPAIMKKLGIDEEFQLNTSELQIK